MTANKKVINSIQALSGYPPEIGGLLWSFEDTRQRLKETLADIDPVVLDWTPTWGGNSISTLLAHIVAIEMDWLYVEVLEQPDFSPEVEKILPPSIRDERGNLTVIQRVSLEDHIYRLDQSRAIFLASFREITLQEFRRLRSFEQYDVTPEWVIHHLIQHEAEHRGQIGELRIQAEQILKAQLL